MLNLRLFWFFVLFVAKTIKSVFNFLFGNRTFKKSQLSKKFGYISCNDFFIGYNFNFFAFNLELVIKFIWQIDVALRTSVICRLNNGNSFLKMFIFGVAV